MDLGVMSVTGNQIMEYKEAAKMQEDFQVAHTKQEVVEGETRPLELFGQTMTIKNEKMHLAFAKVEAILTQIKQVKNDKKPTNELIALYLQTAALFEESLQVLSREKKEEKKKNEIVSSIFTNLPLLVVE